MAAFGKEICSSSYISFDDMCTWFSGIFSHCCMFADQAVRSKLGTDQQHGRTPPSAQQQELNFFQAPEQLEILESSVSAASIVFRGTGSSIVSSSSSFSSCSFCASNPSSITESIDSYSSE
ncbi:hypothetical protein Vretimale_20006, partial [Volvox reticuliferus]